MYKAFLKRWLDLFVALLLLVLLSPLMLVVSLLLALQNGGSPFFLHRRPGYREKPFYLIKFKSMTDERDADGNLLPDNDRITPIGALVRSTSLDELPQVINILKGDMSLIGPRPLLFRYLPLYSNEQRRRHEVRPGITGWAQVNGRNSISWTEKFAYDVYYVDNFSLALDAKIFWMTLQKIITREGVNQSEERPMQPFNGKN